MASDQEQNNKNKKDETCAKKKHLLTSMQQDCENKLTKSGISYENSVEIVLSGWGHLTGASSLSELPFAKFLYRWTLKLVLQGEWPKLSQIVKTRLSASLQQCTKNPMLQTMCKRLLPLVTDPWGHPILKSIVGGIEVSKEEVETYIRDETWEIVKLRIETMVESRCEELALSVLQACMRSNCEQTNDPDLLLESKQDHNHFLDLYFVLLYKYNRNDFLRKVKELVMEDGVDLVRRLLAQQQKAKVWKNRLKVAELAIQIFLASRVVQEHDEIFGNVFSEWCYVMKEIKTAQDDLIGMIRKYIQLAESSQHIYTMGGILFKEFGSPYAALVTELLIGALTRDLNSLERIKYLDGKEESERKKEQSHLERQMAIGFMHLYSIFSKHIAVARECILTAFSLHPTKERLEAINKFANIEQKNESKKVVKTENSEEPLNLSNEKVEMLDTTKLYEPICNNIIGSFPEKNDILASKNIELIERKPDETSYIEAKLYSPLVMEESDSANPVCSNEMYSPKMKEDVDSMDGFLATTEDLIEQLAPSSKMVEGDVLSAPQEILNESILGISKVLCDDLAVVLSSPRWQVLSWMRNKSELLSICEKYYEDTDSARNWVKELKYLNIDYEQFKHLPSAVVNEFTGIEKGYEQYVVDSDEESDTAPTFIDYNNFKTEMSSGSEIEMALELSRHKVKKRKGDFIKVGSDSDSYHSRGPYGTSTSVSDSDSDIEFTGDSGMEEKEKFEGKRVTARANNDRRKRLRVDAATGKLKPSKSLVNSLRLYRHMLQNENTEGNSAVIEELKETNPQKVQSSVKPSIPRPSLTPRTTSVTVSKVFNTSKTSERFQSEYEKFQKAKNINLVDFQRIQTQNSKSDINIICEARNKLDQVSQRIEELRKNANETVKRRQISKESMKVITKACKIEEVSANKSRIECNPLTNIVESIKQEPLNIKSEPIDTQNIESDANRNKSHITPGHNAMLEMYASKNESKPNISMCSYRSPEGKIKVTSRPPFNSFQDSFAEFLQNSSGPAQSSSPSKLENSSEILDINKNKTNAKVQSSAYPKERSYFEKSLKIHSPATTKEISIHRPALTKEIKIYSPSETKEIKIHSPSVTKEIKIHSPSVTKEIKIYSPATTKEIIQYEKSHLKVHTPKTESNIHRSDGYNKVKEEKFPSSVNVKKVQGEKDFNKNTTHIRHPKTENTKSYANEYLKSGSYYSSSIAQLGNESSKTKCILSKNTIKDEYTGYKYDVTPIQNSKIDQTMFSFSQSRNSRDILPIESTYPNSRVSISNNAKFVDTSERNNKITSEFSSITTNLLRQRANLNLAKTTHKVKSLKGIKSLPSLFGQKSKIKKFIMDQSSFISKNKTHDSVFMEKCSSKESEGCLNLSKNKQNNRSDILARAQLDVFNRIMSPGANPNYGMNYNPITMPVSHNPPNLPQDKGSSSGINRVLPKGTTVVRRSKNEEPGPSGLNNGGATMSVISHSSFPQALPTQSRPTVSVSSTFSSQSNPQLLTSSSRPNTLRPQVVVSSMEIPSSVNSSATESPLTNATVVGTITQSNNFTPPMEIVQSGSTSTHSRNFGVRASDTISSVSSVATYTTTSTVANSLGETRGTSMLESLLRDQSGSVNAHSFASVSSMPSHSQESSSQGITVSYSIPAETSGAVSSSQSDKQNENPTICSFQVENSSLPLTYTSSLPGTNPRNVIVSSPQTEALASGVIATSVAGNSSNVPQILLPAQLIQVQSSDGSTGLGIVQSSSLDLRLPPGTRVIKPAVSNMATASTVAINQSSSRPVNLLHNVKIVQNRPIVRTVVVPHSVALQNLRSNQGAQIVAVNQGTGLDVEQAITSSRIQPQLQRLLGHNIVPGGLVIRAVKPISDNEMETNEQETNINEERKTQEESLDERKHQKIISLTTQNVGTQTQSTAVKSGTGQVVSHSIINAGRSGPSGVSHVPVPPSDSNSMNPLNLALSNAVSSEALKQLREFESVFEKVSNKSVKDTDTECKESFPANVSSEESMIAAQLLNMANEPTVHSSQNFCSTSTSSPALVMVKSSITPNQSAAVSESENFSRCSSASENTFTNSQPGTLILVNPSASPSPVSVTPSQPPPAASPALSSTSSHSSVGSSPSSTSSKTKKHGSKPKVVPTAVVSKPKTPPPQKAASKPAVTKPQVEESDEIKAKIQSILDQYKQDLANNPQPQPAPRNRKNCPPPKNEGKSSSKKKSHIKKPDGVSNSSPGSIESHVSVSSSPANLSGGTPGEDSDGSIGGHTTPRLSSQEDKIKEDSPQVVQGVVLSNVKGDTSTINAYNPPTRILQLIKHGNKVTAITTQHPYTKNKGGINQGGPPPNVTIQGRINVNELMENHLASLIPSGSGNVTGGALITKLLQAQPGSGIQQVVLQTANQQGEPVLQQVAVQPIIQNRPKPQIMSQSNESSSNSTINVLKSNNPSSTSIGTSIPSISAAPTRVLSPHSHVSSPPFIPEEESSNGSDQSESTPAPLPPFFTLTKPFMTPAQRFEKSRRIQVTHDERTTSKPSHSEISHSMPSKSNLKEATGNNESSEGNMKQSSNISEVYDIRSNSFDSVKSAEEEQIPPSPATLTKQLQNAYMTEAALSPVISQSQLSSNNSFPSPSMPELPFSEANKDRSSPSLSSSQNFSSQESNGNISSNNMANSGLESSMPCLSSPSGDVYLDQANVGIMDNLPLNEGTSQSPSLSDLVPAVPLLSWSPRSEDSLCDSSTNFPALFSVEGDGASVSSSTSEEYPSNSISTSLPRQYANLRTYSREQDHTVSSTKSDKSSSVSLCPDMYEISECKGSPESSIIFGDQASASSSGISGVSRTYKARHHKSKSRHNSEVKDTKGSRRRSLRQLDAEKRRNIGSPYNGCEKEEKLESELQDEMTNKECDLKNEVKKESCEQSVQYNLVKLEVKDEQKIEEIKQEDLPPRLTRGSKRRNEETCRQNEKKNKVTKKCCSEEQEKISDREVHMITRSRNNSGTSDSSSGLSFDRVSTPGPVDSPLSTNGNSRRKKRGGSHDSSISSRDGSPLLNSYDPGTVNPRRSSSREHSKRKCSCCIDQSQVQGRKSSGKRTPGHGS